MSVLVPIPSRREGPWATNHFQVRRRSVRISMPAQQCTMPSSIDIYFDHPSPNHWVIYTGTWWQVADEWQVAEQNPFPHLQKTYIESLDLTSMQGRRLNYRHATLRQTTLRRMVVVVVMWWVGVKKRFVHTDTPFRASRSLTYNVSCIIIRKPGEAKPLLKKPRPAQKNPKKCLTAS